jgi:RimJ/RimL family protein N-acetyltransferase
MATIDAIPVTLPSGERIVIRSATPDDAAGLLAHRTHMTRTTEHGVTQPDEIDTDPRTLEATLRDAAARAYEVILLATPEHGGKVIGELDFRSHNRRVLAHHGQFGISVDQAWRGKGIGTALIRVMLDWAREHPTLEKVTLGAFATNHGAIRLYERMGFTLEGRREKFFKVGPGKYVDDVQMSIWVKQPDACDE